MNDTNRFYMKILLKSPSSHPSEGNKKMTPWIFLGGPAQGSDDWQASFETEFPEDLAETICNPRRESMGDGPEYYSEQLEWERTHLEASDLLCFWFPPKSHDVPGRDYGQTTRYELGEWITKARETGKRMILGVDPSISGRRYFIEKTTGVPGITVVNSWQDFLVEAIAYVRARMSSREVWFTSDTHFGSERALKLSRRPIGCVSDMDWGLIREWNSRIAPGDDVFHLGDFGDPGALKWLNGNIRLIPGNYEETEGTDGLVQAGVEILEKSVTYVTPSGMTFGLAHRPSDCLVGTDFSLFGHIHGRQLVKSWKGLDVGTDGHHFRPVSLSEVLWWREAIIKHYDSEVWL